MEALLQVEQEVADESALDALARSTLALAERQQRGCNLSTRGYVRLVKDANGLPRDGDLTQPTTLVLSDCRPESE